MQTSLKETPDVPAIYEIGEQVELKGIAMQDKGFHWISGYFVVVQRWEQNRWLYGVSRPFKKQVLRPITEITLPILYPQETLRKAKVVEKPPTVTSHFHGQQFWRELSSYYQSQDLPRVKI